MSDIPLLSDEQVAHLARITWRETMRAQAVLMSKLDAARRHEPVSPLPTGVQSDLFGCVDPKQSS